MVILQLLLEEIEYQLTFFSALDLFSHWLKIKKCLIFLEEVEKWGVNAVRAEKVSDRNK